MLTSLCKLKKLLEIGSFTLTNNLGEFCPHQYWWVLPYNNLGESGSWDSIKGWHRYSMTTLGRRWKDAKKYSSLFRNCLKSCCLVSYSEPIFCGTGPPQACKPLCAEFKQDFNRLHVLWVLRSEIPRQYS